MNETNKIENASINTLSDSVTLKFFFVRSIGLVYLMYRAFDIVCIHKPNTSRPANSERYLVCKGKREECDDIRQYMFELNTRLNDVSLVTSSFKSKGGGGGGCVAQNRERIIASHPENPDLNTGSTKVFFSLLLSL